MHHHHIIIIIIIICACLNPVLHYSVYLKKGTWCLYSVIFCDVTASRPVVFHSRRCDNFKSKSTEFFLRCFCGIERTTSMKIMMIIIIIYYYYYYCLQGPFVTSKKSRTPMVGFRNSSALCLRCPYIWRLSSDLCMFLVNNLFPPFSSTAVF
jgi:hypothetical protein